MPEKAASLDDLFQTLAQQVLDKNTAKQVHVPLTSNQQEIIRGSTVRLFAHDDHNVAFDPSRAELDTAAIVALNNSLVIDPSDLRTRSVEQATVGDKIVTPDQLKANISRYSKGGFHASDITAETIRNLLAIGGYAFLVEYTEAGDRRTPYGYQIGFPFQPPMKPYPTLAVESLPLKMLQKMDVDRHFQIWRTGIVPTIDQVRMTYARLGIPVADAFTESDGSSTKLQRLGGGVATKLVDAVAASENEFSKMQCNIGTIVRVDSPDDVIARNEISRNSNLNIFNETQMSRTVTTELKLPDGSEVAEILWKHFSVDPEEAIRRATLPSSPIVRKKWDIASLVQSGHALADIIRQQKNNEETAWMQWARNAAITF